MVDGREGAVVGEDEGDAEQVADEAGDAAADAEPGWDWILGNRSPLTTHESAKGGWERVHVSPKG